MAGKKKTAAKRKGQGNGSRKGLQDRGKATRAAAMIAAGENQAQVARTTGVSEATVSRWRSKAEVKELIDLMAIRLHDRLLEPVINMYADTIRATNKLGVDGMIGTRETTEEEQAQGMPEQLPIYDSDYHKNCIALRKVGVNVGDSVLKAGGLLPTQMPAPRVTAVIFADGSAGLTPLVQRLLGQTLGALALDTGLPPVPGEDGEQVLIDVTPPATPDDSTPQ